MPMFVSSLFALPGRSLKVVGLKWLGENIQEHCVKPANTLEELETIYECLSCHYLYPLVPASYTLLIDKYLIFVIMYGSQTTP